MSNSRRIQPARVVPSRPMVGPTFAERLQAGKTGRALAAIEQRAVVRSAEVQEEGFVNAEKLREADRLGHVAMSGQAFLRGYAEHVAGENLALSDDCRFFIDVIKLAKGEIVADALDSFRRK
jgi:hypothetical protein